MAHILRLNPVLFSLLPAVFIAFSCTPSVNEANPAVDKNSELAKSQGRTYGNGLVNLLSADEFESVLAEEGENAQLLDLRTVRECADGVIDGSLHADISDKPAFESEISELDKERPVMVYCEVGGRSRVAADVLANRGFDQIYDLRGGFKAWIKANKKTITPHGDF